MLGSLFREHDLKGMTRAQVVRLLGDPEETDYFSDSEMVYVLGPERGFLSIDYEWLLFELDRSERVISYKVMTD